MPKLSRCFIMLFLAALSPGVAHAANLAGLISGTDGAPMGNVNVLIQEIGTDQLTDPLGRFRFTNLEAGTYSLALTRDGRAEVIEGVVVPSRGTRTLNHSLDWPVPLLETIVVTAVSRQPERLADAPGAATLVTGPEIVIRAGNGQIPKLLESTPGVDLLQTTLYDFNINSRGFGRTLNRRVAVIVDGRDPSIPLLGSQEWGAVAMAFDDVRSVEFVRGPSGALYGPNASNGLISITTLDPRESLGGVARLTAGELGTIHADFRQAAGLGNEWYIRFGAGYRQSDGFTVSRVGAAEYAVPCGGGLTIDCLPQETIPLVSDRVDIRTASIRLDKYAAAMQYTLEGGRSDVEGVVSQSNIGRLQFEKAERPWARFRASHPRWSAQVAYSGRDAPRQVALGSGLNLASDSDKIEVDVQTNWELGDSVNFVGGAYYRNENVDSFDDGRGMQSLLFEPVETNAVAIFGQFGWSLSDKLTLTIAARWDDSDTLYDDEFSPRAALNYRINENHALRLGYNRGFQAPNYVQSRLALDVAGPVDLSSQEAFCAVEGVSCGFADPVRNLAVGNPDLGVEETTAFEIGYTGAFGGRAILNVEYFSAQNRDFFTDLLPTQGSPFGNFNTAFGPYVPPDGLSTQAANSLLAALMTDLGPSFASLSNAPDGSPIFAAVSYAQAGRVDTQGVDVGLRFSLNEIWSLQTNYSWFDFNIESDLPGLESVLALNTPKHTVRGGAMYEGKNLSAGVTGRWVDDFRWITGPFVGDVESYLMIDLSAIYRFENGVALGFDITNVLDDEHWENFGGDKIGRRALAFVSFTW